MKRRDHGRAASVTFAILAVAGLGLASPALADAAPSTRLVRCGEGNCLLVAGHRESAGSEVIINGHAVTVEGRRNWRVRLPVSTVRDWSLPFARKLQVATRDTATGQDVVRSARLPIGLLGHVPDLAALVITLQ